MGMDEKVGSTRIIWLKPEGSDVKEGEVVCELDSSAFKDELQAQRIKWLQAKSWVEQAKEIYEFNDLILREYKDGIYPEDLQTVRHYIHNCETDYDRAVKNEAWSREVYQKRYRASAQYEADQDTVRQTALALSEARGMENRLLKYTGPRLIKSMEAKLQSIKSDWLAQQASFGIEDDRLKRLEKMVANCTIRAPKDGILVYASQSSGWGRNEVQILEGVTVREGQTLFDLPDPKHMRVKVKVNESKMASVRPGQRALIRIEAFPGRLMPGKVAEITAIPASQNRFSDVKLYIATVDLDDGGFEGLRPGMTTEITFLIDAETKVTRVPVQAVRWAGGRSFVAVGARINDETKWDWREVTLGLMNPTFAQVVKGLTPGEKVVATPEKLTPAPDPNRIAEPGVRTASAAGDAPHDG